mgnify:FL=1
MYIPRFTTREIRPTGWLRAQLLTQAEGLSGNLDRIWPDVRDSRWIGGDRDGWERVPYWLDGFIPLAYLLDDADMQARAKRYVDAILDGQCADGWLCPCGVQERAGYDMWALFLIGKVLTVWYDCTGDERVPGALYRAFANLRDHITAHPLHNWARSRWFEALIPLYFTYERYPEPWLLHLARMLREQGLSCESLYENWEYRTARDAWEQESHVVNQAMAIKEGALASLLDGDGADDGFSEKMYTLLRAYHGTAAGHFTGDECLSGRSPIRGTELCGVVEAMYSYEILYGLTGDPVWLDRLETLAYNALPATVSSDMWTHQYDQMTNQIACVRFAPSPFRTNGGESNLFGLEPNFGCCTANFNQGFPKFALSTFYPIAENGVRVGIACGSIAPALVKTTIQGVPVCVECVTNYPFDDAVQYVVTADAPVDAVLSIHVPPHEGRAYLDGEAVDGGSVITLRRVWEGRSIVTLTFDFAVTLVEEPATIGQADNEKLYFLRRGPLLFSLPIDGAYTALSYTRDGVERTFPYCDYEIRPTENWQLGLDKTLDEGSIKIQKMNIPAHPFDENAPAITLEVPVYPIRWGYAPGYDGVLAAERPGSVEAIGSRETRLFQPYGATMLRMTSLPLV